MSMVLLIIQGTMMSVVLRYSRVSSSSTSSYLPSVSVAIAEVFKFVICVVYLVLCPSSYDSPEENSPDLPLLVSAHARQSLRTKHQRSRSIFRDSVPMALPAGMFVMQQVLLIWSATYLDAVTYQIFTQGFKLVPTAVFSRLLLGQRLRPAQWLSIPTLALGVVCITTNNNSGSQGGAVHVASEGGSNEMDSYFYLAMVACSIAGLSSSYAGVYFELYVKGKMAGSLIKRNFQLGLYGVPFSVLYALVRDGDVIRERGLLAGFSLSAWGVVVLQVFGGFIIALVVKYCDNILKNFALVRRCPMLHWSLSRRLSPSIAVYRRVSLYELLSDSWSSSSLSGGLCDSHGGGEHSALRSVAELLLPRGGEHCIAFCIYVQCTGARILRPAYQGCRLGAGLGVCRLPVVRVERTSSGGNSDDPIARVPWHT